MFRRALLTASLAFACLLPAQAQRRLVLIDQDTHGPGGTNLMSTMMLLQSPHVQVLGITTVTGDGWRDEETLHALRMLELIGRTDVPVVPGALNPLVRTQEETHAMTQLAGKPGWLGAWASQPVTTIREGAPTQKPLDEDAAHFLIRQVRAHPGQVTIYAGGPLTNIALALSIEPQFAALTKGIVLMGGSLNPQTDDPEFTTDPRHEFNLWFDPESTHIVLHAAWPRIDVTTVDISIKAKFTKEMVDAITPSRHPVAAYLAKFSDGKSYMWDEIAAAAWLDPTIVTKERQLYMDVDLSHGPSYGNVLTWDEKSKPATGVKLVHAQLDLNLEKFTRMFIELMSGPPQNYTRP